MTGIHADIDALKGLREALVRYGQAQREVAAKGEDEIKLTRASLEARASHWQTQLAMGQGELGDCRDRAAQADLDETVDCSGYARAVRHSEERLEHIRRWQQRIDAEASEFAGAAARFAGLLEIDLPRVEQYLLAIITSLEAARRVQAPGT